MKMKRYKVVTLDSRGKHESIEELSDSDFKIMSHLVGQDLGPNSVNILDCTLLEDVKIKVCAVCESGEVDYFLDVSNTDSILSKCDNCDAVEGGVKEIKLNQVPKK